MKNPGYGPGTNVFCSFESLFQLFRFSDKEGECSALWCARNCQFYFQTFDAKTSFLDLLCKKLPDTNFTRGPSSEAKLCHTILYLTCGDEEDSLHW